MHNKKILTLLFIFGGIFLFAGAGLAYEYEDLQLKIFNSDLKVENQFPIFEEGFKGEIDMTLADVYGDKEKEVIVSYSDQENDSKIVIYKKDGVIVSQFKPYVEGFKGMIYLAASDLDNDGKAEIITGAGFGGGPQVRIFDQTGNTKFINDFWAADKEKYRNGVRVAAGDINSDGIMEIITSTYTDKMHVNFYNRFGQEVFEGVELADGNFFEPGDVMAMDVGEDGVNELIVNYGFGNDPSVKVLRTDGSEITSFHAYHPGFGGGVDLSKAVENDEKMFVTGAGFSGGPHVRFLNANGDPIKHLTFFAYDQDFKGGINVSSADIDNDGDVEFVTAPKTVIDPEDIYWPKYLVIDVSKQKLHAYQYGKLIKSFTVSTGRWGFDTPLGKFKVYLKRRSVHMRGYYGAGHPENYDLPGVPYVLSFTGPYTIHGTYWHSNFGYRMSHGCVNMYTPHSKWVYEWSPMGTPVIVHNGNLDAVMGTEKKEEVTE